MEETKRLTREELREPDQVTTFLDHAFAWVQRHPSRVAGVAAAALLLGVLIAGLVSWAHAREDAAGQALATVVETAERSIGAAPATPPDAPGGRSKATFPDAAARDNAIIQEADAMLARHGSSKAARGARMLKAQALARRDRLKDAVELFGEVAGSAPTDMLGASAALARASTRAAAGETDAAVEDLKRLAAAGNPHVPKDLALKTAAELVERGGQNEVAAKLYQRIVDEVPDSPMLAEARAKAQELSVKKTAATP